VHLPIVVIDRLRVHIDKNTRIALLPRRVPFRDTEVAQASCTWRSTAAAAL
jgi:hypothetical protein